jgi:hypothetical protein
MKTDTPKEMPTNDSEKLLTAETEPFRTFFLSALRDSEIEEVIVCFLDCVPHLRSLPPSFEQSQSAKAVEGLVKTYNSLNALNKQDDRQRLLAAYSLTRMVDNFRCYLTETLMAVFAARPETLRSNDVVTIEEVLQCASMDEFVSRAIERTTETLTNKGVSAIFDFMSKRLGLAIRTEEDTTRKATEAIAIRNVVVHNRAKVDANFLRVTRRSDLRSGDLVPINGGNVKTWESALVRYAWLINNAVIAKFGQEMLEDTTVLKSDT